MAAHRAGRAAAEAAAKELARPGYGTLTKLYPATVEGFAALQAAIADKGSEIALSKSLGLSPSAVRGHKRRTKAKLGLTSK
jgi:hypothetical protein